MSLLFFYSYDCIRYSSGDIADAIEIGKWKPSLSYFEISDA